MKSRRFLVLFMIFMLLTIQGPAWGDLPDIAYHTMDFPNGALGVLSHANERGRNGDGGIVRVNVYGDAVIYGYNHDGKDRIILAEHSGYGLGKDILYIFTPGHWDRPISLTEDKSFSWDMRGLAFDDSYFYVANLMQGKITKVRIDDYKIMGACFDMGTFDTGETFDDQFGHLAEDVILAPDGYLYAMDQTYKDYPSVLGDGTIFKLDPNTMTVVDWGKVGASPWDMAYHDGYVYVSCFGGSMFTNGYKATDQPLLQRIPTSSMRGATENIADKELINSEDDMNGYMLLEIGDDGTLYATSYQIRDPFSSRVYVGNVSTLSSSPTFDSSTLKKVATFAGWSRASLMDRTRNLCWISDSGTGRNDSKLVAFNSSGMVESYQGSDLGGYPNMLALTGINKKPTSSDDGAPSAPELLLPKAGAIISPDEALFSWERATDPDGDDLVYDVYISYASDDLKYVTSMPSRSFSPILKSSTDYKWAVAANDGKAGGKTQSETRIFSTAVYSDLLLPNASEDQYDAQGMPLLRIRGCKIDASPLQSLSPLRSADVKSIEVSSGTGSTISNMDISLETHSSEGTYAALDISLKLTSKDLVPWDGLWENLTASASDQDAMRHRILSRISPIVYIDGAATDVTSGLSDSDKELLVKAYRYGDGLILSLRIVLIDETPAEYEVIETSPENLCLAVYDGTRDGKLGISVGLGVSDDEKDDPSTDHRFPSSTGCSIGIQGMGILLLVLPLVVNGISRRGKP